MLRLPWRATVQHLQILRLPRKMTLMIDPCQRWNVIYNARSNTGYRPTSPNIEPATKFDLIQDLSEKSLNCFRQYKDDSTTFRAWSEDNPTIKSSSRTHDSSHLGDTFCVEKYNIWPLRLSPKISRNAAPASCQKKWQSNITKYCACHEVDLLDSTLLYESLFYSFLLLYSFPLPYSSLLYCTVLYCTVLYCTVLYCTLLYSTPLHSTLLYSTLLYSSLLYYSLLYCSLLYYSLLFYSLLYYSLLHYSLLHYSRSLLKLRNSKVSHL